MANPVQKDQPLSPFFRLQSGVDGPLVSVVLLSYARPHYLMDALGSVVEQSYRNLEILVVDNRSALSGPVAEIVRKYPRARLVANSENLGFTGGMNLGIQLARGQYVFLTEDDVLLDTDCISELVRHALNTSGNLLLSGLQYNRADGLIWSAGGKISLGSVFRMNVLGRGEPDLGQYQDPFQVNYISGSMVFSSVRLLRQLGGFRDEFFMYFEDVELCLRARQQGCVIAVVPTAKEFHFEPPPESRSDVVTFHALKNFIATHILHAPSHLLMPFFVRSVLLEFLRCALADPKMAKVWLAALRYVCLRGPQLWRERRRLSRAGLCYPAKTDCRIAS